MTIDSRDLSSSVIGYRSSLAPPSFVFPVRTRGLRQKEPHFPTSPSRTSTRLYNEPNAAFTPAQGYGASDTALHRTSAAPPRRYASIENEEIGYGRAAVDVRRLPLPATSHDRPGVEKRLQFPQDANGAVIPRPHSVHISVRQSPGFAPATGLRKIGRAHCKRTAPKLRPNSAAADKRHDPTT